MRPHLSRGAVENNPNRVRVTEFPVVTEVTEELSLARGQTNTAFGQLNRKQFWIIGYSASLADDARKEVLEQAIDAGIMPKIAQSGDDGGHIIGQQFGGRAGMVRQATSSQDGLIHPNLFAQSRSSQENYRDQYGGIKGQPKPNLERWAGALDAKYRVIVNIKLNYPGRNTRPNSLDIEWWRVCPTTGNVDKHFPSSPLAN